MPATEQVVELAKVAAQAAFDKQASEIVLLDVSDHLVITDLFLICTAQNERQVGAIVDAVEETLQERGAKPIRREGECEGRWVLLDYFDFVVHVQQAEERSIYDLERLWRDCPHIPLELK